MYFIAMSNWQNFTFIVGVFFRRAFETEQRNQFLGWDVVVHKRPQLSKIEDNTKLSTEAMLTRTTMTVCPFGIHF